MWCVLKRHLVLGLADHPQYFTHERGLYMSLYALFLAGSNYFAPVICGFIAQYHGWEWVFYWPAIFCGASIVFLFFLMEETNYEREKLSSPNVPVDMLTSAENETKEKKGLPTEPSNHGDPEVGAVYNKKTYLQKLSILGPRRSRNNMVRRAWQSVYYLSWPVIFYAGWVGSHYSRARGTDTLVRRLGSHTGHT